MARGHQRALGTTMVLCTALAARPSGGVTRRAAPLSSRRRAPRACGAAARAAKSTLTAEARAGGAGAGEDEAARRAAFAAAHVGVWDGTVAEVAGRSGALVALPALYAPAAYQEVRCAPGRGSCRRSPGVAAAVNVCWGFRPNPCQVLRNLGVVSGCLGSPGRCYGAPGDLRVQMHSQTGV